MPFILATLVLIFIGWSASKNLTNPYDGIFSVDPPGLILSLDAAGPAATSLQEGDSILAIDGTPINNALPFYDGKHSGDQVQLLIQRAGRTLPVSITLTEASANEKLQRVTPLIVALLFWLIGVAIIAFQPFDRLAELFFLFCLASATLITSGSLAHQAPNWMSGLFGATLWLIGPLSVHFHLRFPQNSNLRG
jgi:hypothetical protein